MQKANRMLITFCPLLLHPPWFSREHTQHTCNSMLHLPRQLRSGCTLILACQNSWPAEETRSQYEATKATLASLLPHCLTSPLPQLPLPLPYLMLPVLPLLLPRPLLPYALPNLTSTCLALPSAVLPLPRPVWPCLAFLFALLCPWLALPQLAPFFLPSPRLAPLTLRTLHLPQKPHAIYLAVALQQQRRSRGAGEGARRGTTGQSTGVSVSIKPHSHTHTCTCSVSSF